MLSCCVHMYTWYAAKHWITHTSNLDCCHVFFYITNIWSTLGVRLISYSWCYTQTPWTSIFSKTYLCHSSPKKKMDKQKAMLHSILWLIELIYSLPVFWLSFTGKHKVVFVHVNPFLSSVLFCHCTILCLNGFYLGQLLEVWMNYEIDEIF